jgi:hypothetical protein
MTILNNFKKFPKLLDIIERRGQKSHHEEERGKKDHVTSPLIHSHKHNQKIMSRKEKILNYNEREQDSDSFTRTCKYPGQRGSFAHSRELRSACPIQKKYQHFD